MVFLLKGLFRQAQDRHPGMPDQAMGTTRMEFQKGMSFRKDYRQNSRFTMEILLQPFFDAVLTDIVPRWS
jgi:hypothetical protein